MHLWLYIREALSAIGKNRLRAGLTISIIGFGIMAIVGVLTSIDSVKYFMQSSFSTMGANTFKVDNEEGRMRMHGRGRQKDFRPIKYAEAQAFQQRMAGVAAVSLSSMSPIPVEVRYLSRVTNPNIFVVGTDPQYLTTNTYTIAEGRFITHEDVTNGAKVVVIGDGVRQKLFPTTSPIGQQIAVGKNQYRIVGLFVSKGSGFGSQGDKIVAVPLSTILADYPSSSANIDISVYVPQADRLEAVSQIARGIMRLIRKRPAGKPDDFLIVKSDSFVESLFNNLRILTWSATAIALITLLGAGVGLMNIMLVSVTDRTMEIGLRKSLGATRNAIRMQFLTEAVVICQLGGVVGILLGLAIAAAVGGVMGAPFEIPWNWILLSLVLCFGVGMLSGYYPARKAARLDPIEALRTAL